jgi:hypothetical protein
VDRWGWAVGFFKYTGKSQEGMRNFEDFGREISKICRKNSSGHYSTVQSNPRPKSISISFLASTPLGITLELTLGCNPFLSSPPPLFDSSGKWIMRKMLAHLAFLVMALGYSTAFSSSHSRTSLRRFHVREGLQMGLFDSLFGKKGEVDAAAEYKKQQREEMMAAQKEILERRADPKKMREYEDSR